MFSLPRRPVIIDIKSGSDPNCFNITGYGVIPVAILGEATFDETTKNTIYVIPCSGVDNKPKWVHNYSGTGEQRMSNLEQFQAYAAAFEETYADNDWQRLEQYFTADAVYAPGDGTEAVGRDQVLAQLRDGVNGLDRRFDSRALSATPPSAEGDTVSLSWQLTLSKSGASDLTATGVEHATYTDGAISRLEDVFDEGTAEGVGEWMTAHGDSLGG